MTTEERTRQRRTAFVRPIVISLAAILLLGSGRPDSRIGTWAGLRASSQEPAEWRREALQSFDEVWQTVADTFYDPTMGGLDWKAVRADLHQRLIHALRTLSPARWAGRTVKTYDAAGAGFLGAIISECPGDFVGI